MRNYSNIEKSAFHRRTYTGYAKSGRIFRITRAGKGWQAVCRHCPLEAGVNIGREQAKTMFFSDTMDSVSSMLFVI